MSWISLGNICRRRDEQIQDNQIEAPKGDAAKKKKFYESIEFLTE
jgi:hypothetical protein